MALETAAVGDLCALPRHLHVAGSTWLVFRAGEVFGYVLWGALDTTAVQDLLRAVPSALRPRSARGLAFIDAAEVTSVTSTALIFIRDYLGSFDANLTVVRRCAVVRPKTFVLATVAEGFSRIVPLPFETAVFEDPSESLRWLGASGVGGLVDELAAIRTRERSKADVATRLRALFAERLRFVTLEDCAAALGMSARTLQRRLRAAGTTFHRELNLSRVEAAQRLMRETDLPLIRIATDVGCASPAHLTVLFRKVVGQSPSGWRQGTGAAVEVD